MPYGKLASDGIYKILSYMIPIIIITFVVIFIFALTQKDIRNKFWVKNLCVFLVYGLSAFCIIYPIADRSHFVIGIICILLTLVYLLYEVIKYILKIKNIEKIRFALKTFVETASILLLIVYMGLSISHFTKYIVNIDNKTYLNHFKYITTDEGLKNNIDAVDKYILEKKQEGKEVYILDTMAAIYMIPIDEYHKNYDMFNKGNFGGKGEHGIIEDLEEKDDALYLVLQKGYSYNWQMPTSVVDHVRQNFKCIDSIQIFDIYEK